MEALENRDTFATEGDCVVCKCNCSVGERESEELKRSSFLSIDSSWRWLVNMVCIIGMERERGWGIVGFHVAV